MIDPVGSKDYWDPVEICKRDKMLNLIYYKKSISEGQIKEMQDACTKTSQEIRKEKFFKSHTLLKEEFVFFEDIENRRNLLEQQNQLEEIVQKLGYLKLNWIKLHILT